MTKWQHMQENMQQLFIQVSSKGFIFVHVTKLWISLLDQDQTNWHENLDQSVS